MESDGVIEIYRRSINNYSIRHNPFNDDSDSNAYSTIDRERPYGATVFVRKEECVNMYPNAWELTLRRLVKEYKGKKLEDGKSLSGKGRLTNARRDAIQNFYGRAIRDNKGNTEKMSKEIWAILYHYASTADKPMHTNCPTGHQSWCGYQRDIANGTSTYKSVKHPLSEAIVKLVTPIFNRLANEPFLEGCRNVSNQNASESFNNVLWSFCPKERFNSPLPTSLANSLAVYIHNSGVQCTLANLMKNCNFSYRKKSVEQWHRMDNELAK